MGEQIKYPKCLGTAGRNTRVFSMESNLRAMEKQDIESGMSPLLSFKPWASIALSFADSEDSIGGTGNIEVTHIADVKLRTSIAMQAVMEAEIQKKGKTKEISKSEALLGTKILFVPSTYQDQKGNTAYEIAEDIGSEKSLEIAENLEKNATNPKYAESNRKQAHALRLAAILIDAQNMKCPNGQTVAELFAEDLNRAMAEANVFYNQGHPAGPVAAALFNEIQQDPTLQELLKSNFGGNSNVYKIYGPVMKTPNVSKIDVEGYTKAYELSVTCNPERTEYPFRVKLTTMKGLPFEDKRVGVQPNSTKDYHSFYMDLQSWEWINLIERADWEKKMVEMMFHNTGYQIMLKADEANFKARQYRRGNNNGSY